MLARSFFTAVVAALLTGCESESEIRQTACESGKGALEATRAEVLRGLKAPATAVFPGSDEQGVKIEKAQPCRYHVESYVDAENVFGSLVRVRYFAFVEMGTEGTAWRVDMLNFDAESSKGAVMAR